VELSPPREKGQRGGRWKRGGKCVSQCRREGGRVVARTKKNIMGKGEEGTGEGNRTFRQKNGKWKKKSYSLKEGGHKGIVV